MKNDIYREMLLNAPFGYAYHKIILDDENNPIDYVFLEANYSFEKLTGLKINEILNQRVTKIIPEISNGDFNWIELYGEIAINGGNKEFDQYSKPLNKWFRIQAYSLEKNFFSTIFHDITNEKEKSDELERFFSLNLDLLCIADLDANFIKTNIAWEDILGYTTEELKKIKFLDLVHPDDIKDTIEAMNQLSRQENVINFVNRYKTKDNKYKYIEWRSYPYGDLIYAAARDITENKQIELYRNLSNKILSVLNEDADFKELIIKIVTILKIDLNCDAVGFRLKDGDDYPYYSQSGFSTGFVTKENNIAIYDKQNKVCRNCDGSVSLECTCGQVISGRINPNNPNFTKYGSYWTNNSFENIDLSDESDYRINSRNNCVHEGFSSIALIPIIIKNQISGLIQLNAFDKDIFNIKMINSIEEVASKIGETISRKQSEEALRESEEKWHSIIKTSPDGIAIVTLDGIIKQCSDTAWKMYGYDSKEEVIGRHFLEFLDPLYHSKATYLINEMLNGNYTGAAEYLVINKDGSRFYAEINAEILHNKNGEPTSIFVIERDISSRKDTETALNKSLIDLKRSQHIAKIGSWEWDLNLNKIFASEESFNLFGFQLKQYLTYEEIAAQIHPEDKLKLKNVIEDSIKNCKPYSVEYRIIKKDTSEILNILSISEIELNSNDIPIKFFGTIQDISEIRKIENKLKESEERYRVLSEVAKEGILIHNNGVALEVNSAFTRVTGYSKDEIIGVNLINLLIHPDYIPTVKKKISDSDLEPYEIKTIRKDGSILYVELQGSNINYQGKDARVVIIRDIEERKRSEQELMQYSYELERTNEELLTSKDMIETALYQKNCLIDELESAREKMLEAINEKDRFFSIIAHDLKSPFSGFLGITKTLSEGLFDLSLKDMKESLKLLRDSAENIYKLLENLLEWSRIQRGLVSFNPETVYINQVISSIINIQHPNITQKSLNINFNIPENICIQADLNMIHTILRNIISNSIKFTPHNGNIQFNYELSIDNIIISISDTGIGIPQNMISNLFKLGEKSTRIGTDGESSSGLGLLLCKEYVDKHNGNIWIESEENRGTTFFIELPVNQSITDVEIIT